MKMKLKTTKLRDAITFALAVGAITLAGTGIAFAQEAPQETTQETDESARQLDAIVVTGTRIQSQTMTASSPVIEISAEEFKATGATLVEDLVNQYPQLSPVFDNFRNNPSLGYAEIDLRGIGANRTLTLVNGRRIPKGLGETADISIIPPALVQRVDILTGGASAVYGSDAIAGVVNFVLDDQFEGISVNAGYSAYQHKNRNSYLQGLMDDRGFDYPTGSSGFDGISKNIDLAIGGSFGEGGHAVAWATWRKNDPLFQGQRDYSSCALNAPGTACGGSGTADPANFYIYSFDPDGDLSYIGYTAPNSSGTWIDYGGSPAHLYNYAPINYYQRPDTRFTAGTSIKYEINDHFKPYIEAMFVNRKSPTQIAASGAFFTDITVGCDFNPIGSLCTDLGIGPDDEVVILVAKRNVEGGPRYYENEATNYSITSGIGGELGGSWTYDMSFTYGRTTTSSQGFNDFLTSRIRDALLECPPGSFAGCIPYEVWTDSITPEQAQALQGVSMQNWVTDMMVFNAYVTGDLGFGLPTANEEISLVTGVEWRKERFSYVADTNFASGNFSGSGSENPQINDGYRVEEIFLEGNVPLLSDFGPLNSLDAQLGYRRSDYNTSGAVSTYKIGLGANFDDRLRLRAGYNRAIRGANINELFAPQQLGLWSGSDPCAGPTPALSAAECARTGVTAAQYGTIPFSAASQYNGIFGGNPVVEPEEADTWTVGFAVTPIENLNLSLDYYDIKLSKQIDTLGPETIIRLCAGGADAYCGLINRNPLTGDLFRTNDGFVVSTINNFGDLRLRGLDFTANYGFNLGPGRLSASYIGNYVLEQEYSPVPGDDAFRYDCAGILSPECLKPKYRHIANLRYGTGVYSAGLRWRYMGEVEYKDPYDGSPLFVDRLLCATGTTVPSGVPCRGNGKIGAYNYFDLYGSINFGDAITWNVGVNNIADKEPPMVGGSLVLNGNSIGGYDQVGRYFHTSLNFTF